MDHVDFSSLMCVRIFSKYSMSLHFLIATLNNYIPPVMVVIVGLDLAGTINTVISD